MDTKYIFSSSRLGFRNWRDEDLSEMSLLNNDPDVMEHFPSLQDEKTTAAFISRMQTQFNEYQYCYFAVDLIENNEFVGFIGISNQDYGDVLGKFVDIGWRLKKSAWGQGLATEGAKACLKYAKTQFSFNEIYSVATTTNLPSIRVMEKIGMDFQEKFEHPKLIEYPRLKECVLYRINF